MLEPPKRHSLRNQVEEILKAYIRTQGLEAGARLPSQRDLAELLQVSRTVIREAMSSLEAQGVVNIQHGNGVIVVDPTFARSQGDLELLEATDLSAADLQEFRALIHLMTVDILCKRISETELARLEDLLNRMEDLLEKGKTIFREVCEFFWLMIEFTKNTAFIQLKSLYMESERYGLLGQPGIVNEPTQRAYDNLQHHRRIVAALRERNADRVRELLIKELEWRQPIPNSRWSQDQ